MAGSLGRNNETLFENPPQNESCTCGDATFSEVSDRLRLDDEALNSKVE